MFETLVVLSSLFCPQASIAKSENFAEPFQGWYALITPQGNAVEVMAILPDGIAAVCAGARIDHVFDIRYRGWRANLTITDDKEVFCAVSNPNENRFIWMTKFEKPLVIYNGHYSRPLPR